MKTGLNKWLKEQEKEEAKNEAAKKQAAHPLECRSV
jgi:hypothetical protein